MAVSLSCSLVGLERACEGSQPWAEHWQGENLSTAQPSLCVQLVFAVSSSRCTAYTGCWFCMASEQTVNSAARRIAALCTALLQKMTGCNKEALLQASCSLVLCRRNDVSTNGSVARVMSTLHPGFVACPARSGSSHCCLFPCRTPCTGPEHIIFGHDSARHLQGYDYCTGIDTACCSGGQLTACVLPALAELQSNPQFVRARKLNQATSLRDMGGFLVSVPSGTNYQQ